MCGWTQTLNEVKWDFLFCLQCLLFVLTCRRSCNTKLIFISTTTGSMSALHQLHNGINGLLLSLKFGEVKSYFTQEIVENSVPCTANRGQRSNAVRTAVVEATADRNDWFLNCWHWFSRLNPQIKRQTVRLEYCKQFTWFLSLSKWCQTLYGNLYLLLPVSVFYIELKLPYVEGPKLSATTAFCMREYRNSLYHEWIIWMNHTEITFITTST